MPDVRESDLPKITNYSDIKELRLIKTDGSSVSMTVDNFINAVAEKIARVDGFASVVAELIIQEVNISTNEITITLPYGIYMIGDNKENRASICFIYIANNGSGFLLEPELVWTKSPYIITFPQANTINLKHATGSAKLYIFRA